MLVMVTGTYPLIRSKEVAEAFLKAMEEPMSYAKSQGMWLAYGGEGANFWMIFELEKGHEKDALRELVKFEFNFYNIEGYKVIFQTVMKPEDAMVLMGMAPPS